MEDLHEYDSGNIAIARAMGEKTCSVHCQKKKYLIKRHTDTARVFQGDSKDITSWGGEF